jgi:hypothetical protein
MNYNYFGVEYNPNVAITTNAGSVIYEDTPISTNPYTNITTIEVEEDTIVEVRRRKVSSLGTVTLSPKLKGQRVSVVERSDGSFLIYPIK